ncbi:hypothetical protein [Magnetovirga frankeli]
MRTQEEQQRMAVITAEQIAKNGVLNKMPGIAIMVIDLIKAYK